MTTLSPQIRRAVASIESAPFTDFQIAAGLSVLFLLARGAHLVWAWHWPVAGDAIGYDTLAWMTVQGQPWHNVWGPDWQLGPLGAPTAVRTPGFPLFLAAIYAITGHLPNIARLALVVVNAFTTGLLFDASRRQWGRTAALTTTLLWVFWPVSIRALYYVDSLLAESLALPLLTLCIWLLCHSTPRYIWAGIALGFAILTRPHIGLAPLILTTLGAIYWRQTGKALLVCAATACLATTPWVYRNHVEFREFIPLSTQSGLGLWAGWVQGGSGSWNDGAVELRLISELTLREPTLLTASEPEKSRIYANAAKRELEARGTSALGHAAKKAWLFIRPTEYMHGFSTAQLIASLLAAIGLRASMRTLPGQFAAAAILSLLASAVVTFYLGRYRFIATPALLFLAAAGVDKLVKQLHPHSD